jgi:hypothetical protein
MTPTVAVLVNRLNFQGGLQMKKVSKEKELEEYAIRRLSASPLRVNPPQTPKPKPQGPEGSQWHS